MTANVQLDSSRTAADPLRVALAEIRDLLECEAHADESNRAGLLWCAFARLEKILRKQAESVSDPDGLPAETEPARETVLRQQEKVEHDYRNLLEQCMALKWELYTAAQPFSPDEELLGKTPPLKETRDGNIVPDYLVLKEHMTAFLNQMEQGRADAANLVLENLATDLGAGD
jgi:hypothetical protein